MIISNVIYLH